MIIIAVCIAALMVFPSVQYARSDTPSSTVYRYGNEVVKFSGSQSYVGFGNSLYPVSWNIYEINPGAIFAPLTNGSASPLMKEKFNNSITKRVQNGLQDSAVMIRWNNNVKIAEIFSFINGGIDASIAVENIQKTSGQFMVSFTVKADRSMNAQIQGFDSASVRYSPGMGDHTFIIGKNNWEIDTGNISVSWAVEQSIFTAGALSITSSANSITLPFGPLSLSPRETYSIDPTIKPYGIIGGGGGGSSPAPPTVSSLNDYYSYVTTDQVIGAYTNVGLSAQVSSMGSYSMARLTFYAVTVEGSYVYACAKTVYGTGTYSCTWSAQPQAYNKFSVEIVGLSTALGDYGTWYDKSLGYILNVYTEFPVIQNNQYILFNDSIQHAVLYNSSGVYVSLASDTAWLQTNGVLSSGSNKSFDFQAGIWNKTHYVGIYSLKQYLNWTGNDVGNTPGNPVTSTYVTNILSVNLSQGVSGKQIIGEATQAIYTAIEVGLVLASVVTGYVTYGLAAGVMPIIAPFIFHTDSYYSSDNKLQYNNAFVSQHGYQYGYTIGFLNQSPTALSYFTGFNETISLMNAADNSYPYVMNYFTYSASFLLYQLQWSNQTVEYWGQDRYPQQPVPPESYSTSISVPLFIVQG